jgi:hypothetical protein
MYGYYRGLLSPLKPGRLSLSWRKLRFISVTLPLQSDTLSASTITLGRGEEGEREGGGEEGGGGERGGRRKGE